MPDVGGVPRPSSFAAPLEPLSVALPDVERPGRVVAGALALTVGLAAFVLGVWVLVAAVLVTAVVLRSAFAGIVATGLVVAFAVQALTLDLGSSAGLFWLGTTALSVAAAFGAAVTDGLE